MSTIYIVTRGSYSDYQIVSVHSKEADAEVVATRIGGYVEDWELDAENIDHYRHPLWWVRLTRDGIGSCINADTQAGDRDPNAVTYHAPRPAYSPIVTFEGIDRFPYEQGYWEVYVQAPTKDHARKIAQDVIAQHRASYLLDEEGTES